MRRWSKLSCGMWLTQATLLLAQVAWGEDQAEVGTPPSTNVVLWNQPPGASGWAVLSQDFESFHDAHDTFAADDFVSASPWSIETIFVPGKTWSDGCDLTCADALNWQIYAGGGGAPDGDPWEGGNPPVWSLSLAPGDAQVTLSPGDSGFRSVVTLDLNTPVSLHPGTWWLVFYASLNYDVCGFDYGPLASDTTNGYAAQMINPGGGWGIPTTWTSIQDPATLELEEQDLAFRTEGASASGGIGGGVWCDTDGSGRYDSGEGVAGVTVGVKDDAGCDGVGDQLLTSQETAGNGQYLVTGLRVGPSGSPACYVVQADPGDMGDCRKPITPTAYSVALDADKADDLDNDFGFGKIQVIYLPAIVKGR